MKLIFIHADHIAYKTTRRSKNEVVEDPVKEPREIRDTLVVLITVEKADEYRKKASASETVEHATNIAEQVKTKSIVLFPFAHLSHELASGSASLEVLKLAGEGLMAKGYEVHRLPFGWYKEWELKNKGHPLSVLSRSF